MSTNIPGLDNLLGQWWGTGPENFAFAAGVSLAQNVFFGTNPLYQISDFLSMYPKFGTDPQGLLAVALSSGIAAVVINSANEGLNYVVGDVVTVSQNGASGATLQVTSVGAFGNITGTSLLTPGSGYSVANGVSLSGGSGTNASINITSVSPLGGSGYVVNDIITVLSEDASGGTIKVTSVSGSGAVTSFTILSYGTGYQVNNGAFTSGGTGAQLQVAVQQISPYNGVVPQAVLQAYINLASASLVQARWQDTWVLAMGLYVAHFVTLYLRSEGNVGSTAGAIASSGLEKGIMVSSGAGDVSKSIQVGTDLMDWGTFGETTYGSQLVTFAKIIGMGPMYFL
jgi:hypothetical protein